MASRTSLTDFLESRLGDTSHNTLDHLVSRDHQNKIALSIIDWRSIAPFLGLEETDEEDIEVMYSTVKTRNIAMLRKWKHLNGSRATYRKLLEAFWTVERIDLIDKLLEMLAADTPPSPGNEFEDNTLSTQRFDVYHSFVVFCLYIVIARRGRSVSSEHFQQFIDKINPLDIPECPQ